MSLKKALLGTTALLGVGALMVADADRAHALDVSVSGFSRFLTAFGDLQEESGNTNSRNFYFRTDSEVHVKARGKDDATGTEYGATVEFEVDTNQTTNTDESWIFLGGDWGEVRLGNEDGAADNMKVGAFTLAAGTGGIDGAGEVSSNSIFIQNSSDATKIRYDSPIIAGFQLGVSYTPDSGHNGSTENPAFNNGDKEKWVEAGLVYAGSFSGVDIKAAGVISSADVENSNNDFFGWGVGANVGFMGFTVGGGFFHDDDDVTERDIWDVGAGASLGPANVSVTFNKEDIDNGPDRKNTVLSADMGLMPGVALQGDVSFFDRDAGGDDDGWSGVARLHISY